MASQALVSKQECVVGRRYTVSPQRILVLIGILSLCLSPLGRTPVGHFALAHEENQIQSMVSGATLLPHARRMAQSVAVNNDDEVIYLDAEGYLRIWDPVPPNDGTVQWVSPIGGWRDFAVADVNLDGDMEIVAVGGEAESGRLTIYDPVLLDERLLDADRITNDIPWAILYETALLGRPIAVETGDLNPAIPGEEIAFVFALNAEDKLDSDDKSRLSFLQAVVADGGETPDGRAWESAAADVDFGNTWEQLALGDLDADGQAEVVLVDDGVGLLRIYRIEEKGPVKIYENESGARPWQDATVAQFIPSSLQQVALARSSSVGGSTFWVLYYNPGDENGFSDSAAELLLPPPRTIFHGDINNNGDDELFLLRQVPSGLPNPRLIMRNAGEDTTLPVFEHALDADNGYRAGAAGDTDGDGNTEVVIMRDNRIRIYTAPEIAPATITEFAPPATTDQRTVHTGNLDRNGYIKLPILDAAPIAIRKGLAAGGQSADSRITIRNISSDAPGAVPVTVSVVGEPTWLVVEPRSGSTPLEVNVDFDARFLAPATYTTQIIITSPDRTVRQLPQVIEVTLSVSPGLAPAKYAIATPYSCDAAAATQTVSLPLLGPDNLTFSARIVPAGATNSGDDVQSARNVQNDRRSASGPVHVAVPGAPQIIWPSSAPWVTASSPNVLPATMQLTFDPSQLPPGTEAGAARLQLIFFDTDGRQERNVDLSLHCADRRLFLPLINR